MAKKFAKAAPKKSSVASAPRAASVSKAPMASSTPVRNSPIPKASPKREITHEMIAKRAYEIHLSGSGGTESDNWHRAERELRSV